VIWPENTGEVSTIVRTCHALRVPVIAYGAGTSLEGHVSAPRGGICIDMSRMDLVLAVHADDADCVVQPASRAKRSTLSCATQDCSSQSIRAQMRRSAA
jgi:D-lactate dehydrogenase (cytochrome)